MISIGSVHAMASSSGLVLFCEAGESTCPPMCSRMAAGVFPVSWEGSARRVVFSEQPTHRRSSSSSSSSGPTAGEKIRAQGPRRRHHEVWLPQRRAEQDSVGGARAIRKHYCHRLGGLRTGESPPKSRNLSSTKFYARFVPPKTQLLEGPTGSV